MRTVEKNRAKEVLVRQSKKIGKKPKTESKNARELKKADADVNTWDISSTELWKMKNRLQAAQSDLEKVRIGLTHGIHRSQLTDHCNIIISPEDEEKIKAFSKDPDLRTKLIDHVAPSIYGFDEVKEAMLFQMVGGVRKVRDDGTMTRGSIHILLVGEPGVAKSQFLRRMMKGALEAKLVYAGGPSRVLSPFVEPLEGKFYCEYPIRSSALTFEEDGVLCIDDINLIAGEDLSALREAMEQQTVTVAHKHFRRMVDSRTAVLATAQPKYGRFDPFDTIHNQLGIPVVLINQFDLIFALKDIPDKKTDEKLARFILNLHSAHPYSEKLLDEDFFKKYIFYAKHQILPHLTEEAINKICAYFISIRGKSEKDLGFVADMYIGGGLPKVPMSPRQLESLVRLTESSARLRLSNTADENDARDAIRLVNSFLMQVAIDPERGDFDIDRVASTSTAADRESIRKVRKVICSLEKQVGSCIPLQDISEEALKEGLTKEMFEKVIQTMRAKGDIFNPRPEFLSRLFINTEEYASQW